MNAFTRLNARAVLLPVNNIDTDQIIPARFLKVTDKNGLGAMLFSDWRYLPDGSPNPDFVLNQPESQGAQVLIAGNNFGCGSSREHAPIAIKAAGISVVIAKSFARIFYRNAINTGLPIMEAPEAVGGISDGDRVTVDADTGVITNETTGVTFAAQPFPPFIKDIIEGGGLVEAAKKKVGS